MKINPIMAFVALALSSLVAYGFYAVNNEDPYCLLVTIGAGLMIFVPVLFILAVSLENGAGLNVNIVSGIFLVINVISNLIFAACNFEAAAAYVIVNGVIFLIYISIVYGINKSLS